MLLDKIVTESKRESLLDSIYSNIDMLLANKEIREAYSPENNSITAHLLKENSLKEAYALSIYSALKMLENIYS